MTPKTIRTKVILSIAATLLIGGGLIIGLSYREYQSQVARIGQKALDEAREAFRNAEKDDVKMLSAALDLIMANDEIVARFAARDKEGLQKVTAPLLARLKANYGITNWMFIEPEPKNTVFLRVHQPATAGDEMKRPLHDEAIRTKTFAIGKELGKAGFILRAVHAVHDKTGALIGYTNLGEEIGGFLGRVQQQTGNDFAMVMKKAYLDPKMWEATVKTLKIENTWDASPHVVLLGSTRKDAAFASFDHDLDTVPETGSVLGLQTANGKTTLRAIVPVLDDKQRKSGGIILAHDITEMYQHARTTAIMTIGVIAALIVAMSLLITFMMSRLVFQRIDRVIEKTTRVVGGDRESVIQVESDDEVGKIEMLLDQLRQIFAHTTDQLMEEEKTSS